MALPTGTVTLLFSDMEGSTRLLHQLGERYIDALDTQRRILREAWSKHGGTELGTEGDSFYVVFSTARAAVAAAAAGQRALGAHVWPGDEPVSVRMGMHTGQPTVHGDAYVGMDVHRAARVAAAAHGGQILVTQVTAQQLDPRSRVSLLDLGEHRLRDIPSPEHLFQVIGHDLKPDFPAPKTLGSSSSLPYTGTEIVGRDAELRELCHSMAARSSRLITLTGPGGSGKTRLSIALAHETARTHRQVHFIPLENVNTSGGMWEALGTTLGTPPKHRSARAVIDYLGQSDALLVLDNLEQIPTPGHVIEQLLQGSPNIGVVATSRIPTRVVGEREYAVQPLPLPVCDSLDAALVSGAVQLFTRQARLVRGGFEVTADNHKTIAAICRRLDALPLAIELAAARIKLLSPDALLARLDTALDMGTLDERRPRRQQTLRQTIEWSYKLLESHARSCLRLLGVFPGGVSIDALDFMIDHLELDFDAYQQLEVLVDASLVVPSETADGEPRFRTLNTIYTFAHQELEHSGDKKQAIEAAVEWALSLVRRPQTRRDGVALQELHKTVELEYENLRQILLSMLEVRPDESELTPPDTRALELALSCANNFAISRGMYADVELWLTKALDRHGGDDLWTARAQKALAEVSTFLGNYVRAEKLLESARSTVDPLVEATPQDPDALLANFQIRSALAILLYCEGDQRAATRLLRDLKASSEYLDARARTDLLLDLALMESREGRPEVALELEEEAASLARHHGFRGHETLAILSSACSLHELGHLDQAEERIRLNFSAAVDLNDPRILATVADDYTHMLIDLERYEDAATLVGAAAALRQKLDIAVGTTADDEVVTRARNAVGERWDSWLARGAGTSIADAFERATASS